MNQESDILPDIFSPQGIDNAGSAPFNYEEVSITSTSTLLPYSVELSPPSPIVLGRTIVGTEGPWASIILASQNGNIVFENLVGLVFLSGLGNCTISFPVAKVIKSFSTSNNSGVTAISIPNVVFGNLSLINYSLLTSFSAPKAAIITDMLLISNGLLNTISLPDIIYITGSLQSSGGNANLVNFTLGPNLKWVNSNISFTSCSLNQASVDNILERLAALDGTNGSVTYGAGRTVTITGTSSGPSATGVINRAILQARGVIVTTNT